MKETTPTLLEEITLSMKLSIWSKSSCGKFLPLGKKSREEKNGMNPKPKYQYTYCSNWNRSPQQTYKITFMLLFFIFPTLTRSIQQKCHYLLRFVYCVLGKRRNRRLIQTTTLQSQHVLVDLVSHPQRVGSPTLLKQKVIYLLTKTFL